MRYKQRCKKGLIRNNSSHLVDICLEFHRYRSRFIFNIMNSYYERYFLCYRSDEEDHSSLNKYSRMEDDNLQDKERFAR